MRRNDDPAAHTVQRRTLLLCLLLAAVTLALYLPAMAYDFVAFDDDQYIYDNPWVTGGLSVAAVKWALTSTFAANWHPLTWMSHLADYSIYGPFAGGHHLTNIVLHAANTVLLFLVLARMTGAAWPSALAAALFGWHPLHVESVAWISERKDVLSAFFWLLTIWAYIRYVEMRKAESRKQKFFYAVSLVFFLLGLMAKPMVVTLPFVLLLLDYWPLKLYAENSPPAAGRRAQDKNLHLPGRAELPLCPEFWGGAAAPPYRRFLDKLPFFLMSILACVATLVAQRSGGAIKTFDQVSFFARAANVPLAYAAYIGKTFWPSHLCAFYPLPKETETAEAVCALLALIGITALAVRWRRRWPWLLVGWLWFLGTLVPVIGLVQVGGQAYGDRYTYIPSIGLFAMIAWSVHQWVTRCPRAGVWVYGIAGGCLLGCVLRTQAQLTTWRDSLALYTQMLTVNPDCAQAENGLGMALSNAGRKDEAIDHYKQALRLDPNSVHARYNLGIELEGAGRLEEARLMFFEALELDPRSEQLHNNAGVVLAQQGKNELALAQFQQAIQLDPIYPKPWFNAAMALEKLGRFADAVTNYNRALQLEPNSPETLDRLALLLAACPDSTARNPARAVRLATLANEATKSQVPEYLSTLAAAYAAAAQFSNAVTTAESARNTAASSGLQDLAAKIGADLDRYRAALAQPAKPLPEAASTNK